jgi:hypothetical protein
MWRKRRGGEEQWMLSSGTGNDADEGRPSRPRLWPVVDRQLTRVALTASWLQQGGNDVPAGLWAIKKRCLYEDTIWKRIRQAATR